MDSVGGRMGREDEEVQGAIRIPIKPYHGKQRQKVIRQVHAQNVPTY